MSPDESRIPGWYGKMANLGDFASRRLPSRFIVPWDDWLQRALAGSRAVLGQSWLDTYLTSPLWRFLLMPGVFGNSAWSGVIMPSVDRVGRYFPLSIAIELPHIPFSETQLDRLSDWLDEMENAALATLELRFTPEDFDHRLGTHCLPDFAPNNQVLAMLQQRLAARLSLSSAPPCTLTLPEFDDFSQLLAGAGTQRLWQSAVGKSLWWSQNRDGASPALVCCDGLPAPDDFAILLSGGQTTNGV
jgi:type VI secretion system protein ImpM